jgi:outer membrane receptor for ferrienterochelin and colicins
MKTINWLSSPLLLTMVLSSAQAQVFEEEDLLQSSYGEEGMVSIAMGKAQPINKAPAVASVITAKQIKIMGATNLDQVLETVPGLHVSLSSANLSPIYSIRGIQTDKNPQVLMLINGVPMTELYLGDRGARSTLPIHSVARVEVIRGPGSTVYGADAFAGVINVITKNADQVEGIEVGATAGSFDSQEAWLLMGAKRAGWNFYFSIEASTTDGDDDRVVYDDLQTSFDNVGAGLGIPAASLAPDQLNTDLDRVDIRLEVSNKHWTFRAWNLIQEGGNGPGVASTLDPDGESKTTNYLFDTTYHDQNMSKTWEYDARLSYKETNGKIKANLFPDGATLPIGADGDLDISTPIALVNFPDGFIGHPEAEEKHYRLDLSSFYSAFEKHLLRIAGGASYEELNAKEKKNYGPGVLDFSPLPPVIDGTLTSVTGTPYIYIPDEDRTVYYASVQDQWTFIPDWNLTVGVRYDHYSDFGSTINPRVALVWETQKTLTTKFLYGRAFRAPSFAELFTINNPIISGSRNLDPEVINTYEVAFDYEPRHDLRGGLNIFYYEIDDLIEFVADPNITSSTAKNVGEQEGKGFEIEGGWDVIDNLVINGNYAYQNTGDKNNDPTPNAPENQAYLELVWNFMPNWFASTQGSWIGDRKRSADDIRDDIDDSTLLNITIGCQCYTPQLNLSLAVKNMLDSNNYESSPSEVQPAYPGDYPLEGRSIFFSANYMFEL